MHVNVLYVKLERPFLIRGGGLRHHLSPTHNAVLNSLPRQLKKHSHLGSPSPSNQHEGLLGQRPTSGPDKSEFTDVLNESARTLPHRVQKPATPLQLVRTEEASRIKCLQETKTRPVVYNTAP